MHIAIEGLDGVGKTTTAKKLSEAIHGIYVSKAFHLMRDKSGKYDNFTLLSEFFPRRNKKIDLSYGMRSSFLYAKALGLNVVTERYYCTNYAVKPNQSTLDEIDFSIQFLGKPDITFFLYCDYEVNYQRMYNRNPYDKDFEKLEHHHQFYDSMEKCAKYFGFKKYFIDTTRMGIDEVINCLLSKIKTESMYSEAEFPEIQNSQSLLLSGNEQLNLSAPHTYTIKELNITENVSLIPPALFTLLPNLETITVSEANPVYSSENGILYDKNKVNIIKVPPQYSSKEFVVPKSVRAIAFNAFEWCKVESIELNNECEEIGYFSFLNCNKLQTIKFGAGLSKIGKNAFLGCKAVNSVHTGDKYYHFDNGVLFSDYNSLLTSFNNDIREINCSQVAPWAFVDNKLIKTITCGPELKRIGPYAFANSSLEELTIDSGVEILDYAFWNCKSLKRILFKAETPPRISRELFNGINHIVEIVVPNEKIKVYEEAFKNCSQCVLVIGAMDI